MTEDSGLIKITRKSNRGRTAEGDPNPIDIHVGCRLRMRRELLGLSQEKLAVILGLSFQQVQKYEHGHNRIGASRLWDIGYVLDVPIGFFFDDMSIEVASQSPRRFQLATETVKVEAMAGIPEADPMNRAETIELVRDYYRIHNRTLAKSLKDCINQVAKTASQNGDDS